MLDFQKVFYFSTNTIDIMFWNKNWIPVSKVEMIHCLVVGW